MNKVKIINPFNNLLLKKKNNFLLDSLNNKFLIIKKIPRIIKNTYTQNFGYQWNKFFKTQINTSKKNQGYNYKRFFIQSMWQPHKLDYNNILEVGCGAGRFSGVLLNHTKCKLYSIDSSNAVEANYKNNFKKKYKNRFFLYQSDIFSLPFSNDSFDKIFCFGVLQHTPNYKKALTLILSKLKIGGEFVLDFYPYKGFYTKIHAKYFFRFIFKYLNNDQLYSLIKIYYLPVYKIYCLLDFLGLHIFTRFLPICDVKNTIPKNLSKKKLYEWIILDTFDMFSPKFDNPIKLKEAVNFIIKQGHKVLFADIIQYENMSAAVIKIKKIK